ncbi:MAG: hypothetical protein LBT53_00820 [Puniceicoccales bacterium]|jgi:hypothetical protein|nr:hypothetical protein [Puniceicoccales bacterium]
MFKPKTNPAKTSLISLRERVLLVAALWVVALIAGSAIFRNYREASTRLAAARQVIASQQHVIDTQAETDKDLEEHKKRLGESDLSLGIGFQTLVESFAVPVGLVPNFDFAKPRADDKNGIKTTTIRVSFADASGSSLYLKRLLNFEDRLREQSKKMPLVVASARVKVLSPRGDMRTTYDIQTYSVSKKNTPTKTKN